MRIILLFILFVLIYIIGFLMCMWTIMKIEEKEDQKIIDILEKRKEE